MERRAYLSAVSDEEWALVAPYVTLMTEAAPLRRHALRAVFNGLRWLGGLGTLAVVGPWARIFPQLRQVDSLEGERLAKH